MGASFSDSGALALVVSGIHRARTVEQLHRAGLLAARELVEADGTGLYLLNERHQPVTLYAHGVPKEFLAEYEKFRKNDPLFRHLISTCQFTHSMDIFDRHGWFRHPLHSLLTRWGLDYSIEAPLTYHGTIRGTINLARGGKEYFSRNSLERARFLCNEINAAFQRICELDALREEINTLSALPVLPPMHSRRRQVVQCAASGLTNRQIAQQLGISENTVRTHLKQAYRTLGVCTRAQLAYRLYAHRN